MDSALLDPPITRIAGKYERLCWERHARDRIACYGGDDPASFDKRNARRHPRGLYFDAAAGERVVEFIEQFCRHHEGELTGQLIVLEEWQRTIYRAVFGWMRADGTRRYRTAYIEIPRKNGKSVKGSGTGLYLTIADGEGGAQVYSAATKKDQAKIVHDGATKMVKASADLKRFVKTFRNNISCPRLGSKFEPLGADSSTLDGLNTHGLIEDETHAHTDRHVHDVLVTSMGARRQPLAFIITTAGVYDPESIGWELHERAVHVLEGVIDDDSFFAYIAAADDGDDYADPATWAKANPNLGVSLKLDYMAEQCERAKTTPSYLNTFLRYHLNIWTQQITRWIPIERWNACDRVVDELELRGRECYAGLDLSRTTDLTALALAFPTPEGGFDLVFRFWCPAEMIAERERAERLPMTSWVRNGWLLSTEGNEVKYRDVRQVIRDLATLYTIREIAFDPWNATETAQKLAEDDGFTMVEMRQGFKTMSEPSKRFEAAIRDRRIGHVTPKGVHPVMRWNVANVTIAEDAAENIKPVKPKNTRARVDGVIASVMALGRASLFVEKPEPSITVIDDTSASEGEEPWSPDSWDAE